MIIYSLLCIDHITHNLLAMNVFISFSGSVEFKFIILCFYVIFPCGIFNFYKILLC